MMFFIGRRASVAVVLAMAMAAQTWAAGFTGVTLTDDTVVDDLSLDGRAAAFDIETYGGPATQQTAPNVYELGMQYGFMLANSTTSARPANLWRQHVSYDLAFTVEDPGNVGYQLDLATQLIGFVTLLGPTNSDPLASHLTAGASFNVRFDDNLTDGENLGAADQVGGATLGTGGINADPITMIVNEKIDLAGGATLGNYVGTRQFKVRVTTQTAPNSVNFANAGEGHGALRFGATTDFIPDPMVMNVPTLDAAAYPGSDGETPDQHGHFTTLTVTYAPEPASLALLGLGAALVAGRRRSGY